MEVSIVAVFADCGSIPGYLQVMSKDYVPVRVSGVSVEGEDSLPLVHLRDNSGSGDGGLGVRVGPFEASAILLQLEGIMPVRPLTHDLMADFFREGGLSLERAEIFGASSESPRARLIYRHGFSRRAKEVRPSDALALALRLGAPICAERSLLVGPARTLAFNTDVEAGKGVQTHGRGRSSA